MSAPHPPHRQPALVAWVVLGGAAGTAVRVAAEGQLPRPADLPLPTLLVNLVGALVLGALLEGLARRGPDAGRRRIVRLLVGTGFCGGLTTYSTFAVEVDLLLAGHLLAGVGYALLTVLLGLVAAAAGVAAAASWSRSAGARP
ncbi:CrcB family protein [Quadrisphaera sp. INWT6]|uniref:fluoride efflux transporter FluC n=1 Tax=Quadrisphaera sp. INWT6 TaxID=2596917 RepID=UPI00189257A2|nr:CrcB family protein [Quadrisphaera sp. INWT6]